MSNIQRRNKMTKTMTDTPKDDDFSSFLEEYYKRLPNSRICLTSILTDYYKLHPERWAADGHRGPIGMYGHPTFEMLEMLEEKK
jgi:hypothetical protein